MVNNNHREIPQKLLEALTALLEIEKGSVHLYDVAVEHLKNPYFRWIVGGFSSDHISHAQEISERLEQYGTQFRERMQYAYEKQRYKQQNLSISQASLKHDSSILLKIQKQEVRINHAYKHAIAQQEQRTGIGDVLFQNFAEERVHRAWVETQV